MSLESWKAEFYQKDAKGVAKSKALQHSLRKWEGLKKANIEKHGGRLVGASLRFGCRDVFWVDDKTCALCVHYINLTTPWRTDRCTGCPLFKVRDAPCDKSAGGGRYSSPYYAFVLNGDPEPMIALIKLAMEEKLK